jgi:puromycin-sensitive aminopeptidase
MSGNPHRLPRAVVPTRYDLTLEPNLADATFHGTVAVELSVAEATDRFVANAAELELLGATVDGASVPFELDEEHERVTFLLSSVVPAGATATLHITFNGVLNDQLRGFYRSTYVDASGTTQTVGATQMQATDCRRAFPCWDEPDFKAVFAVTLVVDPDLVAVSNAPEVSRTKQPSGKVAVVFADTMIMSSYLVAFVVGRLETSETFDVDGTPMRVIHVPGKSHLTGFAKEIGAFSLRWFENYYGIKYPGLKIDLLALPDFAAGAMENVGCITFRENLLLVDPANATRSEEQLVADVVAHEMAHMWFGDLVTMRWWNGIWLNEAFATFMEVAAVADFRPDWKRWTHFSLDRQPAFEVDSLASTRPVEFEVLSPSDADGMFDTLTYQKGGALLRMLQQYLGETVFRDGVRHYLHQHAYGNTETADLWDSIEHVSGQPVRRIMDTWIWQRGYPLVTAAVSDGALVVRQQRFRFDGEPDSTRWAVPLHVRQFTETEDRTDVVLLDGDELSIPLDNTFAAVVVNAGSHGFLRVAYEPALLDRLTGPRLARMEVAERCSLVDDTWAAVVAGHLGADDFCQFAQNFADETEVTVWQMLLPALGWCDRFIDGNARSRFRSFVRGLVGPALTRIGWSPTDDEGDLVGELRGSLIRAVAILGDDHAIQRRCHVLHAQSLSDPTSVDATVAAAALAVVAATGDEHDYDACITRYRTATNPQDRLRELAALSAFPGREQFDQTLALALSDEVKSQDAPFVFARSMTHRTHGEIAWNFVRDHWTEIITRIPGNTHVRMVDPVKTLTRQHQQADVAAFFALHDIPQGAQTLQQILERQRVNTALRSRASDQLTRTFG